MQKDRCSFLYSWLTTLANQIITHCGGVADCICIENLFCNEYLFKNQKLQFIQNYNTNGERIKKGKNVIYVSLSSILILLYLKFGLVAAG